MATSPSASDDLIRMFDFTRPPTDKEAVSLRGRLSNLAPDATFRTSVERATSNVTRLRGGGADRDLRIRPTFVCLRKGIDAAEVSDRKAPKRHLRPAATRITSSRGPNLRVELTFLAIAQSAGKRGAPGRLPELPVAGSSSDDAWTDVLASTAVASGQGAHYASVRDKKARSIRNALDTLSDAGLVGLRGDVGEQGRYDSFDLLDEGGPQNAGRDPIAYRIPRLDEGLVQLPAGFIENGWVHVLADSELVVLLMVACGYGGPESPTVEAGEVAIAADFRLRHYGIHRDPFSTARKTLEYFGLLAVDEQNRFGDGRARDDEQMLHRLRLNTDGFALDAASTVHDAIERQLARKAAH